MILNQGANILINELLEHQIIACPSSKTQKRAALHFRIIVKIGLLVLGPGIQHEATRSKEKVTRTTFYFWEFMRNLDTLYYILTAMLWGGKWQCNKTWNKGTQIIQILVLMTETYRHKKYLHIYIYSTSFCMKFVNTTVSVSLQIKAYSKYRWTCHT